MKSHIIEATQKNDAFNWGKFLVAEFTEEEWSHRSNIGEGLLLPQIGYSRRQPGLLVLDLQTREAAYFFPHGSPVADLDKHRIWVCPMFEPFLVWLYANYRGNLDDLPTLVELENAPPALAGYRRAGPDTPNSYSSSVAHGETTS